MHSIFHIMFCQTPCPMTTHISRHRLMLCEQLCLLLPRRSWESSNNETAKKLRGAVVVTELSAASSRLSTGRESLHLGCCTPSLHLPSKCLDYKVYFSNVDS